MLQERYLSADVIAALAAIPMDCGICLVTDDVAPDYLRETGHLDQVLRRAIGLGMEPMQALRAATFNPARRLRLWDRGALTPGRAADIALIDDIATFQPSLVMIDGEVVAEEGRCLWQPTADDPMQALTGTVHLPRQTAADFTLAVPIEDGEITAHVINCVPGQTLVTKEQVQFAVRDGTLQLDPDTAYICVVDRHQQHCHHQNDDPKYSGRSFGLIRGLGLQAGAYATTYAHDSHNLAVVGHSPAEMALAANAVIDADGGIAVAHEEQILATIPLPIAGIISAQPVAQVAQEVRVVGQALSSLGLEHPYWLMRISTFTLPVSSGLRITDLGLVDAKARAFVDLFVM